MLAVAMALGTANAGESLRITLERDGHALLVRGSIEAGFADTVRAALATHPQVDVLIVRSRGGLLHEARKLAVVLNARGIKLRAEDRCASACAVMWAATQRRELATGARLGLHRSKWAVHLPGPLRAWVERRNDRANVRTFLDAGFSPALALRAAQTPSSSMYWVDARQLEHEQVEFALQ
ncbi:hypothetical protein [Cognatiluteimonas telluris]|uniref:hypothetical protein n=1 Tax=Cognatiluteimonas telluris TaxID=1104775 RepID=UPI00140768E6|nr:hypothetical protein [Lysobacter telluris]